MTDYNNGNWHFWPGSNRYYDCGYKWSSIDELKTILNVHPKSEIEYFAIDDNPTKTRYIKRVAGSRDWHEPCLFRVVKVYKEPKTIWVNEYSHHAGTAFTSEESARQAATIDCVRVAVKYVEVLE